MASDISGSSGGRSPADEQGLRKSEDRFRQMVEAAPNAMVMISAAGRIEMVNAQAERVFGYSRAEMLSQSVEMLVPERFRGRHAVQRDAFFMDPRSRSMGAGRELFGLRKDGSEFPVEIGLNPIETEEGAMVLSAIVDISDRKQKEQRIQMALERCRAEQVQRDSEAALRQAQKMDAIGQLAGGVAHDFNNLLGVIIGNLDRIAEYDLPDADLADMVQDALGAAVRGASLTRQLLAYSRRQALDPRVVSLNRVVSDLTELLRRTLGETIQIQTHLPADLWMAYLDLNQLENALLNLAVNARDAMPGGGRLTIEGGNVELDQSYADQNAEVAPGRYVLVAVSDTGAGMAKEVADRAFEPFFTTKPAGAGTGLGLSMVYGFVKQSKGHVKIYSEPGRGTAIKLYFPAARTDTEDRARPADPAVMPVAGSGEVILVVEDDAALRKLVLGLLGSLGYAVVEAPDGSAGRLLLDQAGRIDLLLTDVVLPKGMSGPALARHAQSRRPGLKVLYMSGYTQHAVVHNGVLDEGAHLLMKPFRKADLAHRIRRLLDEDGSA